MEIENLGHEIKQLIEQYREEVPGKRRAWPRSIKERVGRLCKLGLSAKEISKLTQISYYNILAWVAKNPHYKPGRRGPKTESESQVGHFVPIKIRPNKTPISTATVENTSRVFNEPAVPISTVTVTLPNGIRIEGATAEFLSSWLGCGGLR